MAIALQGTRASGLAGLGLLASVEAAFMGRLWTVWLALSWERIAPGRVPPIVRAATRGARGRVRTSRAGGMIGP